jgi:hypothetical protein
MLIKTRGQYQVSILGRKVPAESDERGRREGAWGSGRTSLFLARIQMAVFPEYSMNRPYKVKVARSG